MVEENKAIQVINQNPNPNPIELHNSNNLPIGFRLNDTNFKIRSRMIEVHAIGLNKLGYLNGQTPKVDKSNGEYTKWCTKEATVHGWLLKTMEPYLLNLFIDLPTTKDIQASVTQTFYDGVDNSQYYELCCKAARTKQNG